MRKIKMHPKTIPLLVRQIEEKKLEKRLFHRFFIILFLFFCLSMIKIWQDKKLISLKREYTKIQNTLSALLEENLLLKAQYNSFLSSKKIKKIAHAFGLQLPSSSPFIIIKKEIIPQTPQQPTRGVLALPKGSER